MGFRYNYFINLAICKFNVKCVSMICFSFYRFFITTMNNDNTNIEELCDTNKITEPSNNTNLSEKLEDTTSNCIDNPSSDQLDDQSDSESENESDSESDDQSEDGSNDKPDEKNNDKSDNESNEENGNESDEENDIPDELKNQNIIGIDLGTTNTCVGIWRNEELEIIPDEYGNRTIPSFVAYSNVNRYVGLDAKNQKELNPTNVFYDVKRLIGRKMNDPLIEKEKDYYSYKMQASETGNILLAPDLTNKATFTPEEISAAVLNKVKQMASNYLREKVTKCIITIPAHFNDGQRQATKDAAMIAGLDCVRIINEPTAAALAYGLLKRTVSSDGEEILKKIMVYDFGGGTLDVSLLNINNGIFEVLASGGNMRMGGSDFDNRLMSFCVSKFKRQNGFSDITELSNLALQKLRQQCEQAKKILSMSLKTQIGVKNFYKEKDLFVSLTRKDFEAMCKDLFLICLKPVDDVLRKCGMTTDDVDEVILVGGMTRMPKIRELMKYKFNKEPNCTINPDEAVAAGAAIQGYLLSHKDDPFSEAVTLLDTTSLSLGVEADGGVMSVIIERGSIIPNSEVKDYSTDTDNVTSVNIKIYEGERRLTKDNFFVGEFELTGFTPQPRGIPEIEVKFYVDSSGIIVVTATNKKTCDATSLTVTSNKGRLTKAQIEQLIEESQEFEIKDILEKRQKEYYSEIDVFCNNILTNINNNEFKLSDKDRTIVINDIKKVLSWLKEKKYNERDEDEYKKVTENMKHQYGILVLKGTLEQNEVKELTDDSNKGVTTIYGNDDDDDEQNMNQNFRKVKEEDDMNQAFVQMEEEQQGFKGLSEPEKAEFKELRQAVTDLCYSVFEIVSSENTKISSAHLTELRDYIDDALVWLHVHEKPTREEYKGKIDEINKTCDTIFGHYSDQQNDVFKKNEIVSSIKNKRDELENLCYVMKLLISDGAFPVHKKILESFIKKLDDTINWIIESDELVSKNKIINDLTNENSDESNNESKSDNKNEENAKLDEESYYNECDKKLTEINELCEEIQQKLQGINLDENRDLLGNDRIVLTGYSDDTQNDISKDTNGINMEGTDIIALMRRKQEKVMLDLINEEDNETDNDDNNETS